MEDRDDKQEGTGALQARGEQLEPRLVVRDRLGLHGSLEVERHDVCSVDTGGVRTLTSRLLSCPSVRLSANSLRGANRCVLREGDITARLQRELS